MAFQAKKVALKSRTAAELFTDRIEPQNAFWEKYGKMTADQGMIDIIHYYGVGGIGKTTLLKKLFDDLLKKGNQNVVLYSFETNQKKEDFILALSRQISMRLNVEFPVFGYAYIKYMRAVGMPDEEIERKLKTDNSGIHNSNKLAETLKLALAVGSDFIPILGNTVGKIGENLIDLFVERLKNKGVDTDPEISSYLERIDSLTPDVILDELHTYFSRDCYEALMNIHDPFVIMLDGYEFMNDSLKYGDLSFKNDLWICGTDHNPGIIQSLPNVLWIVSGREKIKWDPFLLPEDSHLLGNLSLEDASDYFLKAKDINNNKMNEDLITGLYRLTNGTPVFMDLCFQIYENGLNLCIDDFGKDTREIAKRYLDNLSLDQQITLKFLCGLTSTWTDEMIDYVSTHIPKKKYDILISSSLEIIKEHSFVEKYDDTYKLHETLRNVVRANTDPSDLKAIEDATYRYLSNIINDKNCSVVKRVDAVLMLDNNSESFVSIPVDTLSNIIDMISSLSNSYESQSFLRIANKVYDTFVQLLGENDRDTISALDMLATCYLNLGKIVKAKELQEIIYQKSHSLWGDEDEFTWTSLNSLGYIYGILEEYDKAVKLTREAYDLALKCLGEDAPLVLSFLHELSCRYSDSGCTNKALQLEEQAYEKLKKAHGIDSKEALNSLSYMSNLHYENSNKEKAIELARKIYNRKKILLGEDALDTIQSLQRVTDLFSKVGDLEKAIECQTIVCEGYEKAFGKNGKETLSSMDQLARLYSECGDNAHAVKLESKVYESSKNSYGENDDTLNYLLALIIYYFNNGDIQKSLEYSMELYEKTKNFNYYEYKNSDNDADDLLPEWFYLLYSQLSTLGQLATWFYDQEDYCATIELTKKMYDITSRVVGENSDAAIHASELIAYYHSLMGDAEKAVQIAKEAYERRRVELGESNKDTLISLDNLASYYSDAGDIDNAIFFGKKAYEGRLNVLGENDETTLISLSNLASYYSDAGDIDNAIFFGEKAYAGSLNVHGENDEATLTMLDNLASYYTQAGDIDKALLFEKKE